MHFVTMLFWNTCSHLVTTPTSSDYVYTNVEAISDVMKLFIFNAYYFFSNIHMQFITVCTTIQYNHE